MNQPVSITAVSSLSALGSDPDRIWSNYSNTRHFFEQRRFGKKMEWAAAITPEDKQTVERLGNTDAKYRSLDDSVLYAISVSRRAVKQAGWSGKDGFGINLGSSRGATSLFEKHHNEFLKTGSTSTLASPTTTLGNISSWVAHDLGTKGPEISHSITCSTALHALLNAVAWINGGMADKFLVGGSEAPLTPFTVAQMKALKIYAPNTIVSYPCRALDLQKTKNTMVLGEGAAVACLEKGITSNALALIGGIGYATEPLVHNVSISSDAQCFQDAMRMALGETHPSEVDAVVMHAPGTVKGDASEMNAIKKVFGVHLPAVTTNKWKLGHTFGASGMLSIELAILMMQHQQFIGTPFGSTENTPKEIKKVLVNAVGFGGNAVSILLSKNASIIQRKVVS